MAIQIKTKYLVLAILIAFAGFLALGWYVGSKRTNSRLNPTIDSLNQVTLIQKITIDKKTVYLARTLQELTTERELRKRDLLEKEELRKLNLKRANEITRLKARIDTLIEDVQHGGQIITIHDTISVRDKNCIVLPFEFKKEDEWLRLDGKFNSQGKLDISLEMSLNVDVITGIDKKTKENTCSVLTANPYIKTIGLDSYKTNPPRKRKYGIGLQCGYGLCLQKEKVILAPYVGVGFSANLIRF